MGNTKIKEKSASLQTEATSQTVQKTGTGTMSTMMQSTFTSSKVVSTKSSKTTVSSSSVKSVEEDMTKSITF